MNDGNETRMKKGDMMTMDEKTMEDGEAIEGGKDTNMGGMKCISSVPVMSLWVLLAGTFFA